MSGISQQPILEQLNNGILSSKNAMPLKDLTSDNADSFAMNRSIFQKSYIKPIDLSIPQVTHTMVQRQSPGIQHGFNIQGTATVNQKKWIGGNRDSSQITKNRRVQTTGQIFSTTGPQSFKTISINDNLRTSALARLRSSGSRVPPKVSQKNVQPRPEPPARPPTPPIVDIPVYYRIISVGNNAIATAVSTTGLTAGFYTYLPNSDTYDTLFNAPNNFKRSYNILTIDKNSGITTTRNYDVFGLQESDMTTYLGTLTSNLIVIIATYDEPSTTNGESALSSTFIQAMKNIGASTSFGSAVGRTPNGTPDGSLYWRDAYILVGSPGIGAGNGIEHQRGSEAEVGDSADINAMVDLRISILNGQYTVISVSFPSINDEE